MSTPVRQQHIKTFLQKRLRPISPIPTESSPSLTMLSDVRWVVFDVYGTLLTSDAGEVGTAMERTTDKTIVLPVRFLPPHNRANPPDDDVPSCLHSEIKRFHEQHRSPGLPQPEVDIREIWRIVLTKIGWENPSYDLVEDVALWYETEVNPVWLMPEAKEVITSLRAHYFLGIISNAQFYTPLILEMLLGQSLEELGFSVCTWSFEHGAAKPSSTLFHAFSASAARIDEHYRPADAIYIGNDMRNDIYSSMQHGFKTALFAGDRRSLRMRTEDLHLNSVQPDAIITELSQISDILPVIGESRRGKEI